MVIREKLTYQFTAIVALILLLTSIAIFVIFSKLREEEFYGRLSSKAELVAQMLIEIEEIDTELLKKIEKKNPLNLANEKIVIYNYNNKILYSSDEDHTISISKEVLDRTRLLKEIRYKKGAYEIIGVFYAGKYDRIVVYAGAIDLYGMNKLRILRNVLIMVFLAGLAVVYFAGRFFAAKALSPMVKIIGQVDSIEIANLNARLEEGNNKDEITQLAITFNKMLERIETAFLIQKFFISNASHELRTPLTVISGQLEVTLRKERNVEEYKNTLVSILEDIKGLNNLSNNLLMLTQASSAFAQSDFSLIRLDDIIWQACTEIKKRHKAYKTHVNFVNIVADDRQLRVQGNEQLLKTALYNLIDNACKYSKNQTVWINIDAMEDRLIVHFKDEGLGILASEIPHIFQPFYRAPNAIHLRGHGIGLSLVEKIVHLHYGSIKVQSEINKGSIFTVVLPLK